MPLSQKDCNEKPARTPKNRLSFNLWSGLSPHHSVNIWLIPYSYSTCGPCYHRTSSFISHLYLIILARPASQIFEAPVRVKLYFHLWSVLSPHHFFHISLIHYSYPDISFIDTITVRERLIFNIFASLLDLKGTLSGNEQSPVLRTINTLYNNRTNKIK